MRNFEERKEEIFRRSEKKITQRRKTTWRLIVACIPLVLCVGIASGYLALVGFGRMDSAAPESAFDPHYSLQDHYYGHGNGAPAPETPEAADVPDAPAGMPSPAVTAVSLQMRGSDWVQIYEDPQILQQLQTVLFEESCPETSGFADHTQQDPAEDGSQIDVGKLTVTFTYENGDSVQYTLIGNTVTGPQGSWQLSDAECDQLIKLWIGEEMP